MDDLTNHLLCPTGFTASGYGVQHIGNANLTVNDDGKPEDAGFDDFPNHEPFETPAGDQFVTDTEGNEFLVKHCRHVQAPDHFDPWNDPGMAQYAWSQEMIDICVRAMSLSNVLVCVQNLRRWCPSGWIDTTIDAVLTKIVGGRAQDELDAIELRVAIYRKTRVEPTVVGLDETEEHYDDEAA